MTKSEILVLLKKEGIPEDRYSLDGGSHHNRLCLERKNNRWYVYYSENGVKINVNNFILEEIACRHFYDELVKMIR
ncbi:MAG: hypothetical protein A2189_05000 [Paenibacillus sp. RIFOXYA1_FULL_44_5]|nr:MAG: hypothetical protein A2189_05000 [Paenibacillus sp. RIFOXYA1_FULL_44_5]